MLANLFSKYCGGRYTYAGELSLDVAPEMTTCSSLPPEWPFLVVINGTCALPMIWTPFDDGVPGSPCPASASVTMPVAELPSVPKRSPQLL